MSERYIPKLSTDHDRDIVVTEQHRQVLLLSDRPAAIDGIGGSASADLGKE